MVATTAITFLLHSYALWFLRAGKRILVGLCVITIRIYSRLKCFEKRFFFVLEKHFSIFSWFFGNFDSPRCTKCCFFNKVHSWVFRSVMVNNPAEYRFSALKNQTGKKKSERVNISVGFPKSPVYESRTWQALVTIGLYGSQNKTNAIDIFSLLMRSWLHI